MTDPYKYFRIEASELIERLTRGLLALEKHAPTGETVAVLLRLAHTLKGAARVVKLPDIADDAHALEEILTPFRDSADPVPGDVLTDALAVVDAIGDRARQISSPDATSTSRTGEGEQTVDIVSPRSGVRADLAEMDGLLSSVSEAHAHLGTLRSGVELVDRARALVDVVAAELTPSRDADGVRDHRPSNTKSPNTMNELRSIVGTLERRMHSSIEQIDRELRQVREAAEQLRLVPASSSFTDLERAVRDVAHAQSKRVAFAGAGGTIRLDSHVVSMAQPALQQLVRNAVVHGIETPSERETAGKPAEGTVTLEVMRRGSRIAFVCRDDGRGIDLAAVRATAEQQGKTAPRIEELSGRELVDLLLESGFSTSETVTELSGRGIGLDVVSDAARRLNGEVTISSSQGVGTAVELIVPLSLAALESLAVETDGDSTAIPLDAVRRTLRITSDEITSSPGGDSLTLDGEVIPFLPLPEIISGGSDSAPSTRSWSVVILDSDSGTAAIGVDRVAGTPTIAIRSLPTLVPPTPVVSGTWIDTDGTARLVLEPDGLVRAARNARKRPTADKTPTLPVLVVDDSLTTRMLEQSILESAGYEVELASSAEEALERMSTSRYAIVLVDVEMPGIDGFGFIEQVKADPRQRDTPCILVTSRASADDRRRGEDVGADAYIPKGEFDQRELLTHIQQILGRS